MAVEVHCDNNECREFRAVKEISLYAFTYGSGEAFCPECDRRYSPGVI